MYTNFFIKMLYFTRPKNFNSRFSAVGIYLVHDGKILCLKYSKKYDQAWTLPAGKVEPGEDEFDAAIRETFEETGVKLDKNKLTHLYTAYASYPDADFPWFVYRYDLLEMPEVILSDEHSDYVWVTPEDALKLKLIQHEDDCIKRAFNI